MHTVVTLSGHLTLLTCCLLLFCRLGFSIAFLSLSLGKSMQEIGLVAVTDTSLWFVILDVNIWSMDLSTSSVGKLLTSLQEHEVCLFTWLPSAAFAAG